MHPAWWLIALKDLMWEPACVIAEELGFREVHALPGPGSRRQACDARPDLSSQNAEAPEPECQEITQALQLHTEPRCTLKPPQESPTRLETALISGSHSQGAFPRGKGLRQTKVQEQCFVRTRKALLLQDALKHLPETHPNNYANDR